LVLTGISSCGTFEPVVVATSQVASLSGGLHEHEVTVQTIVRRNAHPFQEDL
jgi:hypothetical protein